MRARQWVIAAAFREPAAYDIPELPEWRVRRDGCGRLVFTAPDEQTYIAAENPVRVRP